MVSVQGEVVLIVDHTAVQGGAELALPRLAENSAHLLKFLFFGDGPVRRQLADRGFSAMLLKLPGQFFRVRASFREQIGPRGIVVSNTMRAALFVTVLRPKGTRHVYYLQDGLDAQSLGPIKRLVVRLVVLPDVSLILANSRWTAGTLPPKRMHLATIVYSPSGSVPPLKRALGNGLSSPVRLLSLGRLVHWKGVHLLLEALEALSEELPKDSVTLTIAGAPLMGSQTYLSSLQAGASRLPFDVRFVGHIENVAEVLSNADILVHASTRAEPFGQVVVQGLQAGLCVVASNAGGPAEIVEDGTNGYLFQPGNSQALAALLKRLISTPSLIEHVAQAAVIRSGEFSDESVTERFDEALESLPRIEKTRRHHR